VFFQCVSKRFLNELTEGAYTTSCGSLFVTLIVLLCLPSVEEHIFYLERIKMQISDQNSSQFSGCKLQGPDSRGSRGASLPKGPSLPHPQSQAPRSRFQIPDIFDAPTPLQSRLTVSTDTTLLIVFQQDCARTRYILSAVQLVHAFE